MTIKNRHGLPRDIPAEIERIVRKRCKFSCVICRQGLVQYEHFNPPFAHAERHDAEGITLLCGSCHDRVTRGHITKLQVAVADLHRRTDDAPSGILLSFSAPLTTILGSIIFRGSGTLLQINGTPLLQVTTDGVDGVKLSAMLHDEYNRPTLIIEKNILRLRADNWDAVIEGPVIRIWNAPREITLELKLHPPHAIHITRIKMHYGDWRIDTDDKGKIFVEHKQSGVFFRSLDLQTTAMIVDGSLSCDDSGWRMTGGVTMDTGYAGARLQKLAKAGRFDQLIKEVLEQPVAHIVLREGRWIIQLKDKVVPSSFPTADGAYATAYGMMKPIQGRVVWHHADGSIQIEYPE